MTTDLIHLLQRAESAGGIIWLNESEAEENYGTEFINQLETDGYIRTLLDGPGGNHIGIRIRSQGLELIGKKPPTFMARLMLLFGRGTTASSAIIVSTMIG